jgi:two-component system sensor histidine kinase/response regulator
MARAFDRLPFAETIEHHPEGVAYVGDKNDIIDCNETFRLMTGVGEGPLQRLDNLVHPSHFQAWSAGLSRFLADKTGTHRLILRLHRDGKPDRWVRLSFLPLEYLDDMGFLILVSDITGQKRLEMKLIRARVEAENATRTKSEFLANTSHEIRTPIHTVIGMSELLQETGLDQEQSDYLGQIRFAADVLLTLINDILDFSKIEAGQLRLEHTAFDLIEMLEDAVDLVALEAHKKNVDIGLFVEPNVPFRIFGDPTRLRQVIVNLVNNAVKFTHNGEVLLDVNTVSVTAESVRLRLSVNDSGIGIPLEKQEHLFQAFHQADSSTTRQFGGTGLGLFISRSIVDQMGGALSFTSEPGEGSSFFFELDFERADEGLQLPVVPEDFFAGRRILVVDDNDPMRNRLARTLGAWGLRVDQAGGAEEALFMMRSAAEDPYLIVIVDQTMPHIDGWQFASVVHTDMNLYPSHKILMSMKGGIGSVEAKMKLLGWFDSYLTKPLRLSDLAAAIFRLLSREMDLEDAEELEELEKDGGDESLLNVVGKRVLIAEDHEVNRQLLRTILEKNGHVVSEAPNGEEAYNIAENEAPDIIFMDCQMPVMNGYESTKKIRESGYGGPIIAVTASAVAEERERCLDCGMSDLVTKPFKQADILMMIERFLGVGRSLAGSAPSLQVPEEVAELEPMEDEPEIPSVDDEAKTETSSDPYEHLTVFDYQAAIQTFLGNEETVRNLLQPQMEKMEGEVETISAAADSGDFETVRTTAHSIKGSCRNMDMNRCGEAAAELEAAGKNADAEATRVALERLRIEFPVLKREVERILSNN